MQPTGPLRGIRRNDQATAIHRDVLGAIAFNAGTLEHTLDQLMVAVSPNPQSLAEVRLLGRFARRVELAKMYIAADVDIQPDFRSELFAALDAARAAMNRRNEVLHAAVIVRVEPDPASAEGAMRTRVDVITGDGRSVTPKELLEAGNALVYAGEGVVKLYHKLGWLRGMVRSIRRGRFPF